MLRRQKCNPKRQRRRPKRQETGATKVRIKSPRSNTIAKYNIYRFARERVQWLIPKWEDILNAYWNGDR